MEIRPDKRDVDLYKQEFTEGLDLFKKSLNGFANADEEHKKAKFKDVMDKTLNVLRETVKASLSKEAEIKEDALEKDYLNLLSKETKEKNEWNKRDIEELFSAKNGT